MRLIAFSVYDVKVEAYMPPLFARTYGEAERFWADLKSDSQSPYSKHPEDYQLFQVGEFDPSTGMLYAVEEVKRIHGLEVANG